MHQRVRVRHGCGTFAPSHGRIAVHPHPACTKQIRRPAGDGSRRALSAGALTDKCQCICLERVDTRFERIDDGGTYIHEERILRFVHSPRTTLVNLDRSDDREKQKNIEKNECVDAVRRTYDVNGCVYPEGFLQGVQTETGGRADAGVRPWVSVIHARCVKREFAESRGHLHRD